MKRKWIVILGIVLLLFVGVGYGISNVVRRAMAQANQPKFAEVKRGDVVIRVLETGTIEPMEQVIVKSKVAGRILHLNVDEGDAVRAGDLIARVDPVEIERQKTQMQADIAAARARLEQAVLTQRVQSGSNVADIAQARAELRSAEANLLKLKAGSRPQEIAQADADVARAQANFNDAQRNFERQSDLHAKGLIALKTADAELKSHEANLAKLKAGARPQEIASAQTSVARAKTNWEDAKRTYERKRGLLSRGFASQQDVDLAETQCKLAEEEHKAAVENLDLVKAGARLEEIAATQAQVERARAALEMAKTTEQQTLDSAEARYRMAQQELKSAQEKLSLLKAGNRSEDIRAAEAQRERARAALANAQARQGQNLVNQKEIDAAKAQLARLQAQLANIETQLSDTTIVAPMSGTVIHRAIEKGELITSGISAFTQGQEIVTIADLSRLIVKVKINEVDVAHLHLRQKTDIRVDAIPNETFTGIITKIAPASAKAQQNAAQTSASEIVWFEVEVTLFNPDQRLKTGMSANVDIVGAESRNVVTVSREAVMEKDGKFYLHRVKDHAQWDALRKRIQVLEDEEDEEAKKKLPPLEQTPATEKIEVQLGLKNENRVEVKSGVAANDVLLIKEPAVKRRTFQMDRREGGGE
jgi:HlyD family secretion protein